MPVTVEQLNRHFSTIPTDPHYLPPPTKATANTFTYLLTYFLSYAQTWELATSVRPNAHKSPIISAALLTREE